jgi:hypothetical protein
MSAYTPGPWRAPLDEPFDPERPTYFLEDATGHQLMLLGRLPEAGPDEHKANVRLIAAAPDLLAALKQGLEEVEDGLHHLPCDAPDCWMEAAGRAIAKATGTDGPPAPRGAAGEGA